ncbi:hypothetical protein [uncultured Agathobaculum sp.]|uniref:tetratricopeptide repeat protein n=1 Tax=uncultured Agathobaculum sp. TaxID=2048140 RepID=UPI00296EB68B
MKQESGDSRMHKNGMSTEKLMLELQKFLEEHADEIVDEQSFDRLQEQFMAEHTAMLEPASTEPETAYDYLELAQEARSKKQRMAYLNKAVEVEPDNVDAQLQLLLNTHEDKPATQLPELKKLLEAEETKLKKMGVFQESMGDFWLAIETRPYMRVYHTYFEALIFCGMLRQAIHAGERMLELCEGDNLGVRYRLMHLYVQMEDEMHALALHKKYDSYEETQMLLPLAVLYYKLNQFDKAGAYLNRLAAVNKDTKKFLRLAVKKDMPAMLAEREWYGYQPMTIQELVEEFLDSMYLFRNVPFFFEWAQQYLRAQTAAKRKKSK